VSFAPPAGEPTLAQENKIKLRMERKIIFFIIGRILNKSKKIIRCKNRQFLSYQLFVADYSQTAICGNVFTYRLFSFQTIFKNFH
jgi:hypothetical protein